MAVAFLLAVVSASFFLTLAHAALRLSPDAFSRLSGLAGVVAVGAGFVRLAAGVALLAPVLLSRRLAPAPVPATVPELLERYRRPR